MSEQSEQKNESEHKLGTGRRKRSVARVRLRPNGHGQITVKKRTFEDYFPREQDRNQVLRPLHLTNSLQKYDVTINVHGGGVAGQAGAVQLGIARALAASDEAYFHTLKDAGLLTRDSRQVERKKPGKKGARASFQFSKR